MKFVHEEVEKCQTQEKTSDLEVVNKQPRRKLGQVRADNQKNYR